MAAASAALVLCGAASAQTANSGPTLPNESCNQNAPQRFKDVVSNDNRHVIRFTHIGGYLYAVWYNTITGDAERLQIRACRHIGDGSIGPAGPGGASPQP